MDMILDKSEISCRREIWSGSIRREEMTECVVPDTCPDAVQIADVCAQPMIRSKEASSGKVTVTAAVTCTALYTAQEGPGLFRLECEIPFTISADVPEADEETDLIAALELGEVEIRLLNPRKILARVELSAFLRCFSSAVLTVSCTAREDQGLQLLEKTCTAAPVTEIREKTFTISDEIAMPPAPEGYSRILRQQLELVAEDSKFVGSKLIFKGEAQFRFLAEPAGGGRPVLFSAVSSFSQLLEFSAEGEGADVTLCLTGAELELSENESGRPVVTAQLHLLAQAAVWTAREVAYLADAYSNTAECRVTTASVCIPQCGTVTPVRDTYRVLLETPETPTELLCASARCSDAQTDENGVTAKISIRCLYAGEDGSLKCAVRGDTLRLDAEVPGDVCRVMLRCGEVYASPAAGGIDLRVPLEAQIISGPRLSTQQITAIETEQPEQRPVRPSLYVLPLSGEPVLWPLAKKYASTVDLIRRHNPQMGDVLIIPVQQ